MMERTPLPKGAVISFQNGGKYIIDDLIGEGGFSLVYSAHTAGGRSPIVIKEFFPAEGAFRNKHEHGYPMPYKEYRSRFEYYLKRFDSEGIIGSLAVQESYQIIPFQQCAKGYALIQRESKDMRSLNALVEYWKSSKPLPYSGITKDYDPMFGDLVRVSYALRIIDSVLTALAAVHNKGYLHLDLSSRNVIWAGTDQETGRNCAAFLTDFGCAININCNMDEIEYRPTGSPGFAAPELMQGKACVPATDLFSVGILLFYLCCADDALEITRNRNRQIQREFEHLLIPSEIKKSCINLITRATSELQFRYGSTEEFQVEVRRLSQMIDDFNARRVSFFPFGEKIYGALSDEFFVGRDIELAEIEKRIQAHQSPVFLCGIGGIGKTAIAQKFAERFGWKYNVYSTSFKGSFKKTIAELDLHDDELDSSQKKPETTEERYATNIQILKKCNDRTILIIDNADTQREQDLRAEKVFKADLCGSGMAMQFIITTRNDMRTAREAIPVESLDMDSCLEIARKYYSSTTEYKDIISEICKLVNNHTITIELIAKTLEESRGETKPIDILNALMTDEIDDQSWEKVETGYGLDFKSRSVIGHLMKVFSLSKLSANERFVLGSFAMAESYFHNDEISRYWNTTERRAIKRLIAKGWLSKNNGIVSLHPCMRYVVLSNAQKCISWNGCSSFIIAIMHNTNRNAVNFDIQRRNQNVFRFVLQHPNIVCLSREYTVLICCFFIFSCGATKPEDPVYNEIQEYYRCGSQNCESNDIIRYWLYGAYHDKMVFSEIVFSEINDSIVIDKQQCDRAQKEMWYNFREYYVCQPGTQSFIAEEISMIEQKIREDTSSNCGELYKELVYLCWMINDKKGEVRNAIKWYDLSSGWEYPSDVFINHAMFYSMVCIHCIPLDVRFSNEAIENIRIVVEGLRAQGKTGQFSWALNERARKYFVATRICELAQEDGGLKEWCERKGYYYSIMGLVSEWKFVKYLPPTPEERCAILKKLKELDEQENNNM